ncbi:hypothetical protein FPV67DRAFT_902999 [Lyophyllum atratum]|nr:hypothetical protein FPV67DRAFT_902999 [Lyophyllum atratum]
MSYVYPTQWSQTEANQYNQYAPPYATVPSNILRPNAIHHQQAIPVSSYSTLSGALDFSSVTSSASRERSHSISKSRSRTTAYPSPYDSPHSQGRAPTHSHSVESPSRRMRGVHDQPYPQESTSQLQPLRVRRSLATGPTNHVLVPQLEYRDEEQKQWCSDIHIRLEPITFQVANFPEPGVQIGKIANSAYSPAIIGANDAVFAAAGDREIKLWILWPGCSGTPMQKRMKTKGGKITRELTLMLVANLILECMYEIYRKKVPVEQADWTIGATTDKKPGFVGDRLFITRLLHRGGSNWQPELWAPRRT